MSKILRLTILFSLLFITKQTIAQVSTTMDGPLLTMGRYIAIVDNSSPTIGYSAENGKDEHQMRPGGIVVGSLLLSGGFAAGITGQILGKKAYSKYLRSAFTDNTDRLRKRVTQYNIMRVAGGICAGTGTFILIFSF